jgi:hypothetical protein
MTSFRVPAQRFTLALAVALGGWSGAYAEELSATVRFSKREVEIIAAYYREAPAVRSEGHGRKLPRGIAKNLARGKQLPPGIAKQPLPRGLIAQLPPPPPGLERLVVAGKILLVEIATQTVRDVLNDALFR